MYANRTQSEHQTNVRNPRKSRVPLADSERAGWQQEQRQYGSEKRTVTAATEVKAREWAKVA